MKKTRLKIALSTLLVIFNLVFCFVATYAWFVGIKDNDASGLVFKMESYDLDIEYYKIFKYSDDEKCGIDVTSDSVGSFHLPKYDTVITTRNKHAAVILLFCIKGEEIGSTTIRATLSCNPSNNTPYDDDVENEVLSNVVRFKFAPISTSTIPVIANPSSPTPDEAASIYDKAVTFFETGGEEIRFSTNLNKSTTITKSFASSTYSNLVVNNKLYFYMLFDYSSTLIDTLLGLNPAQLSANGQFIGDLVNLRLSALAEDNP